MDEKPSIIEIVKECLALRLNAQIKGLEGAVLGYDRQLAKCASQLVAEIERLRAKPSRRKPMSDADRRTAGGRK